MLPDEGAQYGVGRVGAHVEDRLPGKLTMGRQVADREDVRVFTVDGAVRLNVICCPHAARMVPTQPMDEPLVLVLPDASEAKQHVLEFIVRHGWELGPQRGHANMRAGATQEPNYLIPQVTG
jgi:hypothetical protein